MRASWMGLRGQQQISGAEQDWTQYCSYSRERFHHFQMRIYRKNSKQAVYWPEPSVVPRGESGQPLTSCKKYINKWTKRHQSVGQWWSTSSSVLLSTKDLGANPTNSSGLEMQRPTSLSMTSCQEMDGDVGDALTLRSPSYAQGWTELAASR